MIKHLSICILMLFSIASFAQKKQKDNVKVVVPLKDNSIFYERIIDSLGGQSQELIFNNSLKWMADSFVDSKEVIQIKDKEAGSIVGTGVFDMKIPGFMGPTYRVSFRVELTARDSKSRIRFYTFKYKHLGTTYSQEYASLDEKYMTYADGKSEYPGDDKKCFSLLNEKVNQFIASYETHLFKNSKPDEF